MALLNSNGQPSDQLGSDGDNVWDYKNRIFYGPKGIVTAGSWTGTANSVQGPAGTMQLVTSGVPSNDKGVLGQGACDFATGITYVKGSSGWAVAGSFLGPQGPQGLNGYTSLTTQASVVQKTGYFSGTVSSTATVVPTPNTTAPMQVTFAQSSALTGMVVANAGVAITLSLVDVSTGTSAYSVNVAANTSIYPSYTLTQYPLTAGKTYQWQITGSGSAQVQFDPTYLMPAATSGPVTFPLAGFSSAVNYAFTSTAIYPGPFNQNRSSSNCRSYAPKSSATIPYVQGQYIPSVAGAATATVTVTLLYYNYTSGNTTTLGTFSITNSGTVQQTNFSTPLSVPFGGTLYSNIVGSGTGTVFFEPFITQ